MASYDIYWINVRHEGLNKFRLIRGRDKYNVEQRAAMLQAQWDEMWDKKQKKESEVKEKDDKKQLAKERTLEAQKAISEIKGTLKHTLEINDAINWDSLLDRSDYPKSTPIRPLLSPILKEPIENNKQFVPKINFIISIFPRLKQKRIQESRDLFVCAYAEWNKSKSAIEERNRKLLKMHKTDLLRWEEEKKEYIHKRDEKNMRTLQKKKEYFNKDNDAIVEYCEMVLTNSQYPDEFPQEFEIQYIADTNILLVDYLLPSKEQVPTLKEVRYIVTQNQLKDIYISEVESNKLYDDLLYQITLRTIHELYEADVIKTISSIIFNGNVKFIDKGVGKEVTSCILSIQAGRDEFLKISLSHIEPKTCFKALKGIGSSKLHGLAPIAPIAQLDKEDRRFVPSHSIATSIDDSTNIAAMHWEDFEHLIRELFEKEFAPLGGEVKITQASRDAGVDAVIFDPDPIRGGKIVIQAKRYTNVVGVSAVRDLYGTLLNEGAMKGILVTTSDYGPDAYNFVKDKPLTLLNGNNLLHLLQKHGHKARIDIKEAKKVLIEREQSL